jgi:hypothetical protein
MGLPDWVSEDIDLTVPNAARMYDYALGGFHNFAVDREYVNRAEEALPGFRVNAQINRAFLGRAVRWLVGAGIEQFLDIGSGIPTLGNVHEIAQRAAPQARVVYVDIDPVAVAHSQAILAGQSGVRVLEADLRGPAEILFHPEVNELLDFSQPVAVLMTAVMHFVSDTDDPAAIVAQLRDVLVSGSYITITHVAPTPEFEEQLATLQQLYRRTPTPFHLRTPERIAQLLTGFELVEPGIVPITEWRPESHDRDTEPRRAMLAAVARKP